MKNKYVHHLNLNELTDEKRSIILDQTKDFEVITDNSLQAFGIPEMSVVFLDTEHRLSGGLLLLCSVEGRYSLFDSSYSPDGDFCLDNEFEHIRISYPSDFERLNVFPIGEVMGYAKAERPLTAKNVYTTFCR